MLVTLWKIEELFKKLFSFSFLITFFLSSLSHLTLWKSKLEQFTESVQTHLNQSEIAIFFSWDKL